jgi:hypothetical protein
MINPEPRTLKHAVLQINLVQSLSIWRSIRAIGKALSDNRQHLHQTFSFSVLPVHSLIPSIIRNISLGENTAMTGICLRSSPLASFSPRTLVA